MVGFFDINTVWRRKFGEALRDRVGAVLLCAPVTRIGGATGPNHLHIAVPPGWAGVLSVATMPYLLWHLRRAAHGRCECIVLTTPHYRRLAQYAVRRAAIVYYCSDDYRSYSGWDSRRMVRDEAAVCRLASLCIFVSEPLRARAVAEYGLDPARTLVSANATEPRFAAAAARPRLMETLRGPIFGAAGVINARIDLAFLAAVADDPRVGSLALLGPVEAEVEGDAALTALRAHPKVHFLGAQPHETIHEWMASFDVAVIPYAATPLNHFCSPMRLYDHLAIGQPILATPHCAQVCARSEVLTSDLADLEVHIGEALQRAAEGRKAKPETWDDRIDTLQKSAVAALLFPQ